MALTRTIGFRNQVVTIPVGLAAVCLSPNTDKFVVDFELYNRTGNTSSIFIGDSTVDAINWVPLAVGSVKNYVHGEGTMIGAGMVGSFNFKNIFVKGGTAGDVVVIQYFVYENS